MLRMFIMGIILMGSQAVANEPPPIPPGLSYQFSSPCDDKETGEEGTCHVFTDKDGWYYTAFWQGEEIMFIRKSKVGEPYEVIWERDTYRGI